MDYSMFHPDAFREIVLNAIVHKDYSGGNPVQISVYPDRIYVWNDGTFPPELNTAAKLFGKHSSKPYNPGLAGVFFKCGLIEAWGRGFDKITAGCKEYGGPRPSYKIGESGVMVLCKACPAYLELKNAGIEQLPHTTQTTTQSTTQTTAQKILAIIKANPNVSRSALSREIGLSSDGIKWHLQKLKEGNAIRRVGPKYGGHWEVVE